MNSELKILFMAAEMEPLIKVGGLADVTGSLPRALRNLTEKGEHLLDVRVVLPAHGRIATKTLNLRPAASFTIPHADGPIPADVDVTEIDGVLIYLVSGPLIPRSGPVYSPDASRDGAKFAFFSLAALELARALDWAPDVVHAHDWHTAPAVYWLGLHRDQDPVYRNSGAIQQIHNLPYLGAGAEAALESFGLPPAPDTTLPEWARRLPLPLGIWAADRIVTVSPGYAAEMLTPEFGAGLDAYLQTRKNELRGILNGIDLENWNPETDRHIVANYSLASLPFRTQNKTALQKELELPQGVHQPLIAMITRLDHQKGVDLALEGLHRTLDQSWQAVILGTGQPHLEEAARGFAQQHPERARALIRFDGALARRVYAGADMILIPSRYEPCGLTQMIAMRYGCVPVARATGGLRDTIRDYNANRRGTGFLFDEAHPEALADALRRALSAYNDHRRWQGLRRRGMREDFSWDRSAREYIDLYEELVRSRQAQL